MRMRVLELPAQPNGEDNRYPFVYVIDGCTAAQADEILATDFPGGAEGVIVFKDSVELPAADGIYEALPVVRNSVTIPL